MRAAAALVLVLAAQGLAGCAATKSLFKPKLALTEVEFEVARDANDTTAFPAELVAVSDEALLARLLATSADQWFDPDAPFKRDYPAAAMQTWYYELTPGLSMRVRQPQFGRRGLLAVLLFAHYKGKGNYRLRLDAVAVARVRFAEKTIELADKP
jgi:hypothetical protein